MHEDMNEPSGSICEEGEEEVEAVRGDLHGHFLRNLQKVLPAKNLPTSVDGSVGIEGSVAHQTFVHDHSEAPPVTLLPITLLQQHFWSNIIFIIDTYVYS